MLGYLMLALAGDAQAARPSDLAPGAPELQEAEQRLIGLVAEADAVRGAASRLQARWVALGEPGPGPKGWGGGEKLVAAPLCGIERVDVGWRIERFGAAWREAAQAVHAQAVRVASIRSAATVAPLVDDAWAQRLKTSLDADPSGVRAFLEASVWQARFVRPFLDDCAARRGGVPLEALEEPTGVDEADGLPDERVDEPSAAPPNGEALAFVWENGHVQPPVAILAAGDGWICPGAVRADDAIVLLEPEPDGSARACWSASSSCGCAAETIWPGGVLAPAAE